MSSTNKQKPNRRNDSLIFMRSRGSEQRIMVKHYGHFITILEKVPVFSGLSIPQFHSVLAICHHNELKAGTCLFCVGEEAREMHVLIKGELSVCLENDDPIVDIKPIGIVGEMGVFCDSTRSATVTAATDCLLLSFHGDDLMHLIDSDYSIGRKILLNVIRDLADKIRIDNKHIAGLRQDSFTRQLSNILAGH